MEKLIIITSYSSLQKVDNNVLTLNNFESLKDEEKEFVKFNDEIIFVRDRREEIWTQWWDEFLNKKPKNEKWYVIHHTRGIQPEQSDSIICKEGINESTNPVYSKVVEILLDEKKGKKERIIWEVFKPPLEAVLEFLHGCLDKEPGESDYKKLTEVGIDANLPELKGEPYSEKYFESLEDLRDKLFDKIKKKNNEYECNS